MTQTMSTKRVLTPGTDYRTFLRALKKGQWTIHELTGDSDRPEKLRSLVELMGADKFETSLIRAFDNDHVDQESGKVLWVEHKKALTPPTNGEPKRAGTGSDPLPPPPAPVEKKTHEQIQALVNEAVERNGANILDRADGDEILAQFGLKREEVTERMVDRADSRAQKMLRETFAKANEKTSNRGKVVWEGDEQLDPTLNPDHPIRGAAAVTREREEREKAATRERLNGLRAKNNGEVGNGEGTSGIMTEEVSEFTFTFDGEGNMNLSEKSAKKLLVAAGVEAKNWSSKKLAAALNDQERLVEATEPEDEKLKEQFNSILKAVADGKKITVTQAQAVGTNGTGSKKEGKSKKEKGEAFKGPGVISSIVEFLQKASEKKPLTKKDLTEKLAERFPERSADSMGKTVNAQVPSRLAKEKNVNVHSNDNGYWIS